MIFLGDIALPFSGCIDDSEVEKVFHNKLVFGNLEGGVIESSDALLKERVVFNDKAALVDLFTRYKFGGVSLANNHIFDTATIDQTVEFLKQQDIDFVGLEGHSFDDFCLIKEDNTEVIIMSFGWEVIGCKTSNSISPRVNSYSKDNILRKFRSVTNDFPKAYSVCYFHWNYELEELPSPFDRELSHLLIDNGADLIVGCHSHRIQPVEIYKNKPIVYGLGNFIFPQGVFFNKKIKYPDFTNIEYALEVNFEYKELYLHLLEYDKNKSKLAYKKQICIDILQMDLNDLSEKEYLEYYKNNRTHKRKALPVYNFSDSKLKLKLKNIFVLIRGFFINILVFFNVK